MAGTSTETTLTFIEGTPQQLTPCYEGEVYRWSGSGSAGLSCTECPDPTFDGQQIGFLRLVVTRSLLRYLYLLAGHGTGPLRGLRAVAYHPV